MVDADTENSWLLSNTWFKHKLIHKYIWGVGGCAERTKMKMDIFKERILQAVGKVAGTKMVKVKKGKGKA